MFWGTVVSDSCDPLDCSPPGSSVHGTLQASDLLKLLWAFDLDHLSSHTWLLLALNQEDTPTQVSHSLVLKLTYG